MNDRGEKIVALAREMLRTDVPEIAARPTPGVSFKVLFLTTALAAAAGGAVTSTAYELKRPLNRYEKVELDALVFYAARLKGVSEDSLRHDVETHFSVESFNDLTAYDYRLARDYLRGKIF